MQSMHTVLSLVLKQIITLDPHLDEHAGEVVKVGWAQRPKNSRT